MKTKLYGLKKIRQATNKTQEQVARELDVPLSSYQGWEQLKNNPELPRVDTLARYFGCTVDRLLGRDNGDLAHPGKTSPDHVRLPFYGAIAAGSPTRMHAISEEVTIPLRVAELHPRAFVLTASGDSMNNRVANGQYAVIDPDREIHNGDVVAVSVNGEDATLKVWYKTNNSIILSPDSSNPLHRDLVINEADPSAPELRILGKMIWALSPYLG
ncbi:MAG TPA: hypothetical protein DEB24_00480 [Coriobacteriia bacterium]|nr:hypothetical protein [Coriobacteriia bacterium]